MTRKLVSGIMLSLLLIGIFTLAFNIQPVSSLTILSQDFDDELTGSVPQGWTVENPEVCSLTVNETVYYGTSGKSARFVDSASFLNGYAYVGRLFTSQSDSIGVEFKMRAEVPGSLMFYIDDGISDYDGPNGANIYFQPDGWITYLGTPEGTVYLRPFSINTWYRVSMVIDVSANTYDIYIDGSLEAEDAHFRGFGEVTQLSRMHFGANSAGRPIGYIDEISVSSPPSPPPPPVPEFPLGLALETLFIPVIIYILWRSKKR